MKENNSTAENSRPNQHSKHTHSHTKSRKRRRRSSSSGRPSGHVIFVIVFSIILVVTIVRLFLWNRGRQSDYDPNETTTEFDVEVMDYLQPLDPEMLEGHEDDGVTTVLALGNDLLSDDRSDTGLAALMEKSANATILNAAFPGSSISMKHQEFDNSYPLDGVSLYWVAAALLNQNFDLMDVIVPQMNSEAAAQALETLKSVDLSKVDDLVILYDLQDYRDDRTVYDEANDKNLTTVYGALTATIKLFQEQCPHIRIYLLSQPYGTFTDANGKTIDIDRDDLGNGTMVDYLNWEVEACRKNGVSFIDNYYGAITMEDTDCLTDGYHLNQKGREKIAERFGTFFLIVSLISASSLVLPYSTTKVSGHDTTRLFSLTDLMINIITSTIRTVTEPAIKYLTHLLFIKHTNFLI